MKKKHKKQARVAIAVTLVATSVFNFANSIFAQEELEISEYEVLNNERITQKEERAVGDVEVNATNFPNDVFRDYVSSNFDNNKDGVLSSDELNKVTVINLTFLDENSRKGLTNVIGIEHFPNLDFFDCSATQVTSLDVSKNLALKKLGCDITPITSLDVSKNRELEYLSCEVCPLTSLDVSNNTVLKNLYLRAAQITSLDVSKNRELKWLFCGDLAWLHIGDNPNLYMETADNSIFDLGEIDKTFNIQEKFPGIDLNRITSISGATLDKTTGIVSGYNNEVPIRYTYDCGTAQGNQEILNVTLNFTKPKEESNIIINDDLNKIYDGQAVEDPKDIVTTGSTGVVSFEWYTADGTKLDSAPVNAGSYKVKAILEADANYASAEVEKAFDITKANSTIMINDDLNKVYDGQAVMQPNITQTGSQSVVVYEWYVKNEEVTKADPWTRLSEAPVEAGNYKLVVSVAEDTNYYGAMAEAEFSIKEAQSEIIPTPGEDSDVVPEGIIEGVQTGDHTQIGLWTMLAGLAIGIMLFFTNKKSKEEK